MRPPTAFANYLTPIATDSLPAQCIVMDTEINHDHCGGDTPGRYWAGKVSGVRWRYEDGKPCRMSESATLFPSNWWEWVAKQCRTGTVTQLFAYDILRQLRCNGLLDLLADGTWRLTEANGKAIKSGKKPWQGFAVLGDPPTILLIRPPGNRGALKLIDLRNYGVGSRKEIGKEATWIADAETWVKSVIEWIRVSKLGTLQATAGAQALHSFRRRFLPDRIECWRDAEANRLEKESFYGGRCECYKLGKIDGPIYHLDVNSLYPAACIDLPVPTRLFQYLEGDDCVDPLFLPRGIEAIATVEIQTELPHYPMRRDGLIIYPIGKFTTTLAGPELTMALDAGCVRRIFAMSTYHVKPTLHAYMEWMYLQRLNARMHSNKATEGLIKRMLVGLPGKFIQQERSWLPDSSRRASAPWRLWREIDSEAKEVLTFRTFGWQVQRECIGGLADHAVPAIGAWITSAARVHMHHLTKLLPAQSVVYTDTDSLWLTPAGYEIVLRYKFQDSTKIGLLKYVESVKYLEILGIKHYIADGRVVRAGWVPGATEAGRRQDANPVIRNVNADLANGCAPQAVDQQAARAEFVPYRHGLVGEDGWVKPWRIGDA